MKFTYAYKTSDGVRHEAAMTAVSRDAVFQALRKQGIKAIKVAAADGSKANGEVRGVRKRIVVAVVLLATTLVGLLAFYAGGSSSATRTLESSTTSPRHQIYGDPAILEEIEHCKFDAYLPRPGDQLLAWFVQPGKFVCPKNIPQAVFRRLPDDGVRDIEQVADSDVVILEDDPREVRELKMMVNGIRSEMREYLANGNGTIRSFWRRLIERTRKEAQIYERVQRELQNETNPAVWEQKNETLRNLGLRTIPNPKDAE